MADQNNTETIADLATKANSVIPSATISLDDGRTFIVRRDDFVLDQVTPANKAEVFMPKIVSGVVHIQTAASMADYINRFKNADTVLFADIAANAICGVIDYHGQPPANMAGNPDASASSNHKPDPRLLAHQAMFSLSFSEQWTTWISKNDRTMTQVELADFLEQNGVDIVDPTGADFLEIIQDLNVYAKSSVKSRVRNGDYQSIEFSKDSDISGSREGSMDLPNKFKLRIPVYFGEGPVDIDALVRIVVSDGGTKIGYKLVRPESTRQNEFQRIVNSIASQVAVTTIYGRAK